MAKRIFSLVERIALLASQQGGYVSHQAIATHLGTASQQAFNALVPAKGPRNGPGMNRETDTRLAPFLRRQEYRDVAGGDQLPITNGRFDLPATCAYVDYYDIPDALTVEEVSGAALRYRRTDPNVGPTLTTPIIGTVEGATKQVYPVEITNLDVLYYGYPELPVYAESEPTEDAPAEYLDGDSVDTGWGAEMDPELIVRSLRLMGLEIRDPALQAIAAQLTAESL